MSPDRRTTTALIADRSGATAVEFALVLPMLVVLVAGLVDLGQRAYSNMVLANAARAGAAYAMIDPTDTAGIHLVVLQAANMTDASLAVTSNQFCECPDGSSVSCTGSCTGGGAIASFVDVTATQRVVTVSSYAGLLDPVVLSGHAVFRIR